MTLCYSNINISLLSSKFGQSLKNMIVLALIVFQQLKKSLIAIMDLKRSCHFQKVFTFCVFTNFWNGSLTMASDLCWPFIQVCYFQINKNYGCSKTILCSFSNEKNKFLIQKSFSLIFFKLSFFDPLRPLLHGFAKNN